MVIAQSSAIFSSTLAVAFVLVTLGLGGATLLGWRGDVPALLAAADLLVCPSRHEPLGNVVIEAWAPRTPVVAARSQGPGALIEDGQPVEFGQPMFLVKPS